MRHSIYSLLFGVCFVLGIVFITACSDDDPITEPSAQLEFSTDTLTFDTVFTAIGSATRIFKVYNRHTQPIVISRIALDGGSFSPFRINIDGAATLEATDLEVPAEDSIYIFAEVTIDPDNANNPFVINDAITFETNGNTQQVTLEAWGQNANYIGTKGGGAILSCQFNTWEWDDPKPYVIYGILIVDSCDVVIRPGTRVHVHGGLVNPSQPYNDGILFIGADATLTIEGTKDEPVIIQGDRLEADFEEEPGQWAGILIGSGSTNNSMTHTTIRNSIVGVRVDSAAQLSLQHCTIHNTNSSNLLGVHADIYAENCLFFSSNSQNNVQLEYGGNYLFNYCTIATFSSAAGISHNSPALRMTNARCLDQFCEDFFENPLNAQFQNCIIYGSRIDEIQLFDRTENGNFTFTFDHCLIKADENEVDNSIIFDNCNQCVINSDPFFVDVRELDYHLDTLSAAEAMGIPINNPITNQPINIDIEHNLRDAATPDIGAYEYQN